MDLCRTKECSVAFETALLKAHLDHEKVFEEIAQMIIRSSKNENPLVVILHDRGALDVLAYVKPDEETKVLEPFK